MLWRYLSARRACKLGRGLAVISSSSVMIPVVSVAREISLATETTGGDSSRIFDPNMASEAISECLIFKNLLGEHAPTPP